MTPDQVRIVQESFARVIPVADTASRQFYKKLFVIAPELRPMFNSNMTSQGSMFVSMLSNVVDRLDSPATIIPLVEALAIRHRDYGVVPEHYGPVGAALLYTVANVLGNDFNREIRGAWVEAFSLLANSMIEASSNDVISSPVTG